jgi:hypothetical protein
MAPDPERPTRGWGRLQNPPAGTCAQARLTIILPTSFLVTASTVNWHPTRPSGLHAAAIAEVCGTTARPPGCG